MTIAFVRHGQTAANRAGLLQGRVDPPLTELGRRQGARLAEALAGERPARVFTSPLRRARETAELVARLAGAGIEVDERLVELDYGEWDGRPIGDVSAEDWASWRRDPGFAPPGGESLRQVAARVGEFCTARLPRDDGIVVAVSHVSPIKAAVTWAIGADESATFRMHLALASITRIAARGASAAALVSFNEVAHLRALAEEAPGG
jgi:probable phosphoglycerate mutase